MKQRRKPKYLYEIGLSVREIWIMEVVATSKREAKRIVRVEGEQTCSVAGSRGWVQRKKRVE